METKKVLAIFVLLIIVGFSFLATAGDLEPSAAPAPTMKTLNEVEPRIAIGVSDLPLIVTEPGSYYLAEDVNFTNDANNAITIECDDVTIDLTGYTIKGPDSGATSGVFMHDCSNVEIRNGTIRDFGNPAIWEDSSSGTSHRVINIRALSSGWGISLKGYGHLVKDCTAAENGDRGIDVSDNSTVTCNTCYKNGSYGIYTTIGCTVTGNTCYDNNGHGIYTGSGNTLIGNTSYSNNAGDNGILAGSGCTLTGNTCYDNGGRGISAGQGSTIIGNTAKDNDTYGIYTLSYCLIDQNTMHNNTSGNLVTGAGCEVGLNVNP